MATANKRYKDLPTIPKYMTPKGWSTICWSSVLGQCTFGKNCIFCRGHIKPDKILQEFADGVCNMIAKGVLHLCKNNEETAPLQAVNKKCIASKWATANEWQGKSSQIPKTVPDKGNKTIQKKALLGKFLVEWEHRVATSLNSPIWEPTNTPTHRPGKNSKGASGKHQALRCKEKQKMRALCSMRCFWITDKVRYFWMMVPQWLQQKIWCKHTIGMTGVTMI